MDAHFEHWDKCESCRKAVIRWVASRAGRAKSAAKTAGARKAIAARWAPRWASGKRMPKGLDAPVPQIEMG